MDVDEDRLRTDIETNATFGAIETDTGRGRTVLTGTTPNRQAREHLVKRLEGAAHDTMHIAGVTDAGLLFAPSRDGVSHSPREWTDWDDCVIATQALTEALATLAM